MSKVAILTQPLGHNYGGLLQAYALQRYIKQMGFSVVTLDRRSASFGKGGGRATFINLIRLLLGRIKSIPTAKRRKKALRNLLAFRDEMLSMSPEITSVRQLVDYVSREKFGVYVVGSDQVWRPRYSPNLLNYYFDFLDDANSAKRIAYAASFGVDAWEYSDDLTKRCKDLIRRFDAVSVREEDAVEQCARQFGVSAQCVVDPTLLLEPSDYDELMGGGDQLKRRIEVLCYVLDPAKEKREIVNRVGEVLGGSVFSIMPDVLPHQVRSWNSDKCEFPSVVAWLQAFRNADFVVTDSFHGTVFSILFNKKFVVIGNSVRGNARLYSLLMRLGLSSRIIRSMEDLSAQLILSPIDWDLVNGLRSAWVCESKSFLSRSLFSGG